MRTKGTRSGQRAVFGGTLGLSLALLCAAAIAAEPAESGSSYPAVTRSSSLCERLQALLETPLRGAERQKAAETHRALGCRGVSSEARLPPRRGR